MATFVLIHGAWHGGWCWKKLTPPLRQAGHEVCAPTLSGMGDRSHLHRRGIGLDTHIEDVVQFFEYEDLKDIILVGHSYGGMVISGAAERVADRIARLVFLDAFTPQDGQSAYNLMNDGGVYFRNSALTEGDGWFIPPLTPADMGVTDPTDAIWMQARMCPITSATFEQSVHLSSAAAQKLPRSYIHSSSYFDSAAQYAREHDWDVHTLLTGHDVMITSPRELVAILLKMI